MDIGSCGNNDGYEKEVAEYVDKIEPLFISSKGINPLLMLLLYN